MFQSIEPDGESCWQASSHTTAHGSDSGPTAGSRGPVLRMGRCCKMDSADVEPPFLHAHDLIAAVDVDDLAGDGPGPVAGRAVL